MNAPSGQCTRHVHDTVVSARDLRKAYRNKLALDDTASRSRPAASSA